MDRNPLPAEMHSVICISATQLLDGRMRLSDATHSKQYFCYSVFKQCFYYSVLPTVIYSKMLTHVRCSRS